ncbi:MAG: four helix bundle protein [bacterium]|nr:four helix bundle protein [bacterium]
MQQNKEELRNEFKLRIYKFIVRLLKFLSKIPYDAVANEIKKQLTRSGTSIGANFFEARGASSKKDFQNFFTISLKSANETCFWLSVLLDANLIPKESVDECKYLLKETKEIANIFASSIITMRGKRKVF